MTSPQTNPMTDYSELLESLEELETFIKLDTGHPGAERVRKARRAIETLTRELAEAMLVMRIAKREIADGVHFRGFDALSMFLAKQEASHEQP